MQLKTLLMCLSLAACSSVSEDVTAQNVEPPSDANVLAGTKTAAVESHFEPPIEVSDLVRSNPNNTPQWMVCLRSSKTEESKRITYSAFFNEKGYVSSRYSVILDPCASQTYHAL